VAAPNLPITHSVSPPPERQLWIKRKKGNVCKRLCSAKSSLPLRYATQIGYIHCPIETNHVSFNGYIQRTARIQFADIFKHAWAYWISSGSIVNAGHAELAQMMQCILFLLRAVWKAFILFFSGAEVHLRFSFQCTSLKYWFQWGLPFIKEYSNLLKLCFQLELKFENKIMCLYKSH
jgi:hypothetical protein